MQVGDFHLRIRSGNHRQLCPLASMAMDNQPSIEDVPLKPFKTSSYNHRIGDFQLMLDSRRVFPDAMIEYQRVFLRLVISIGG